MGRGMSPYVPATVTGFTRAEQARDRVLDFGRWSIDGKVFFRVEYESGV